MYSVRHITGTKHLEGIFGLDGLPPPASARALAIRAPLPASPVQKGETGQKETLFPRWTSFTALNPSLRLRALMAALASLPPSARINGDWWTAVTTVCTLGLLREPCGFQTTMPSISNFVSWFVPLWESRTPGQGRDAG